MAPTSDRISSGLGATYETAMATAQGAAYAGPAADVRGYIQYVTSKKN
jgi:hypothetical protein